MIKLGMYESPAPAPKKLKIGMMVQNDIVGVVGRVIYVNSTTAVVQEFGGRCHELNPENCKEVTRWVRLMAWISIAKKLRGFFVRRIVK
jgi:hypothetical protein